MSDDKKLEKELRETCSEMSPHLEVQRISMKTQTPEEAAEEWVDTWKPANRHDFGYYGIKAFLAGYERGKRETEQRIFGEKTNETK